MRVDGFTKGLWPGGRRTSYLCPAIVSMLTISRRLSKFCLSAESCQLDDNRHRDTLITARSPPLAYASRVTMHRSPALPPTARALRARRLSRLRPHGLRRARHASRPRGPTRPTHASDPCAWVVV